MVESQTRAAARSGEGRTLTGWKEIAVHFDKGVRTVQRWEEELSLPVRRIKTGRGDTVYAFVHELEAWRRQHGNDPLGDQAVADDRASSDNPNGPEAVPNADAVDEVEGPDADRPVVEPSSPAVPPARVAARPYLPWTIGVALVMMAVASAWVLNSPTSSAQSAQGSRAGGAEQLPAPTLGQPADWKLDVDTLRIYDAEGRLLWSYQFDGPPVDGTLDRIGRSRGQPWVRIEDFDGDGRREVVVAFSSKEPRFKVSTVFGFDDRGAKRFAHAPSGAVRFGDRTYAPPWEVLDVFLTGDRPGRRVLWVAWVHVQSGNFPCLLERLSPNGDVESAFWSAGYVSTVVDMVVQGRPSILVGAANNDHRGASLAVFDADSVRGSAPAESADKTCVDCPPGGPRAFLVFPRMEFKRLVEGFPVLFEVRQQSTGELRVFVDQGYEPGLPATTGNVHYDLDENLVPRHVEIAANYVATHRHLQSAGLLDHPFGDPDRREAWPVLAYNNGTRRFEPISGQTEK